MLPPNSATLMAPSTFGGYAPYMYGSYTQSGYGANPPIALANGGRIETPHYEWTTQQLRWRWLLDSWEGGEAYRTAIYGWDIQGQPVRNLIRHKREYPDPHDKTYSPNVGRPPGTDPAAQATDDDYELRRARTPVPTFVADCVH